MSSVLFLSLLPVVLPYCSGFSVTAADIHISSQIVEDHLPFLLGSVAEVIVGQNHSPQNYLIYSHGNYRTEFCD